MRHMTKILLSIITLRVRNKIKSEIIQEQCAFVEVKGTNNAIFISRTLTERTLLILLKQKDPIPLFYRRKITATLSRLTKITRYDALRAQVNFQLQS